MSSTRNVSSLPLPPGPRGMPVIGSLPALRRDPHLALTRMARQYGDVFLVRLGNVPVAVINHPALLEDAFARPELTNRWETTPIMALTGGNSFVVEPYGERWQLLDEFSRHDMYGPHNLDMTRENHVEPVISELVEQVGAAADAGEPVSPNDILYRNSLRMAFRNFFGDGWEGGEELTRLLDLLREDMDWTRSVVDRADPADLITWTRFLPSKSAKEGRRRKGLREDLLKSCVERVSSRPGFDPSAPACLVDVMLAREASGDGFRHEMIYELLMDMMMPHTDGVATTVKFFLLAMGNRPQVQEKIHEELDRMIGREARPVVDDRARLPYTFAAVAETMRYHTASPLGIPHEASRDTEVGGYRIPVGTKLLANLYGIHHDPRFWESPHEFIPERFLPQPDGSPADALTGGNFIPFGLGHRRCTGEHLGEMEIWLYVTRLMQNFRFERTSDDLLSEYEIPGLTITPEPFTLKVTRRR